MWLEINNEMGFDEKESPMVERRCTVLDAEFDYQLGRFGKICLGIILGVAQPRSERRWNVFGISKFSSLPRGLIPRLADGAGAI